MQTVAVIGLGNISNRHRKNLRHLYPDTTILAMSASGNQPSNAVEDCDVLVADIEELVAKSPELVIVASPASLHLMHTEALLQAGIPTLVEKPVASTLHDANNIAQLSKQHATPVAVGYCLRYLPAAVLVKQLVNSGELGEIYNVFAHVGQYLPDWRPSKDYKDSVSAQAALGGGALRELSHELDYCSWLFGELEVKHATLRSSNELGLEVEDIADVVAISNTGALCNIHLNFLEKSVKRQCIILAANGTVTWDLIQNSVVLETASGRQILLDEPEWDKNNSYLLMIKNFVAQINNQPYQSVSVDEATKVMELVENIEAIVEKTTHE